MMVDNEKVNILMVDDQPGKLLSYEAILGELGENLIKASSGREALECLLKTDVAVILLDVSMPDMDGFDIAEAIREHPRFQRTAIIFVSGVHLSELDRIKGYERGAVDYISVPVVPEVLRAKVTVFTELHRKTRQLEALNRGLEQRVIERTQELHEREMQIRSLNEQLNQRVTELETIMRVLPVGVAVAHDPDCQLVTGNAALSEMLGMRKGDNLSATSDSDGLPFTFHCGGARLQSADLPLERAARTGKAFGTVELDVRLADGHLKHALASANPLLNKQGEVEGAVGVYFDVTERKRMEEMLRVRADLLDLATEAIMVRDWNGTVHFWNAGAEALYGWNREEVIGRNLNDILRTRFPISPEEIAAAILRTGRWEGDLVQYTKDGRELITASRQAAKPDSHEFGGQVLEINRDITAQLRAEDALRKSERMAAIGRFAGVIAHEINNPLEAITNLFYLLREHQSLDSEAKRYARMAEEELVRVGHITKQTLSFYRDSQHPVPVCLPTILDEVLELQSSRLRASRIVLERAYRADAVIVGFPAELKQVFVNLIDNALQAMPEGGRLRIRVFQVKGRDSQNPGVNISICDTGPGIEPEHAKRLFEPFFTTKAIKGTGLGLWISRGIIEKHEGVIRFRSFRGNQKCTTCFSVFLPTLQSAVNPGQQSSKQSVASC